MEVWEGSVFDGKMVLAVQVAAPSAARRLIVGISLSLMTAGLPPSKLMMKTWSTGRAAWAVAHTHKAKRARRDFNMGVCQYDKNEPFPATIVSRREESHDSNLRPQGGAGAMPVQ